MFASVAAGQAEEASLSPAEMLAQARNMTTLQLFESGDTVATLVAAREAVQANVAQLGDGHERGLLDGQLRGRRHGHLLVHLEAPPRGALWHPMWPM